MASRTLKEKIGPTVLGEVQKTLVMLSESPYWRREKIFRHGKSKNGKLVCLLRRRELLDEMMRINPDLNGLPDESLRRALNPYVEFLTDAQLHITR